MNELAKDHIEPIQNNSIQDLFEGVKKYENELPKPDKISELPESTKNDFNEEVSSAKKRLYSGLQETSIFEGTSLA